MLCTTKTNLDCCQHGTVTRKLGEIPHNQGNYVCLLQILHLSPQGSPYGVL